MIVFLFWSHLRKPTFATSLQIWKVFSFFGFFSLYSGIIMMIACCNDGTRPVIFKIERIDIPENDEEAEWLAKQNFKNTAEDAYTG